MTKAMRMMQENIKLVDLIIELVDARAPVSSRNPDIDSLANGKARIILLNKYDLADNETTLAWIDEFERRGLYARRINARSGAGLREVKSLIEEVCSAKREKDRSKGIINRPLRAMVVGIPNVGKSTFINIMAGKACTKTGSSPGVTRGKQWIRLNRSLELLDTPGVLWPKFDDERIGIKLAFIGAVKDEVVDHELLAYELIKYLVSMDAGVLTKRYDIAADSHIDGLLEQIGRRCSCLLRGNEVDTSKAARILLEDFRCGRLGHISLEAPPVADAS